MPDQARFEFDLLIGVDGAEAGEIGASFDLFTFWCMILVAIGLGAASKRLSAGKAFGIILFPWALIVILPVGAAALSG